MALSNTATPKYYAGFREAVRKGKFPVNREVASEMNRIDALIADPRFYYDEKAMDGFIAFAEGECTLTDGSPLTVLPIFKVFAEQLLCWFYYEEREVLVPATPFEKAHYAYRTVKLRLTKKQYIIMARGGAKSVYESLIQNYFLNCDPDATHQITTAPTMKQAEEVMSPISTAIGRAHGPLFKLLTHGSLQNTTGSRMQRQQLAATKKGIQNFLNSSLLEIRPMAINKLQGLRCKVATVDEWLSGDLREDVIGAIEQGASKLDNYIILAVSSEGTVRNGAGDGIKLELAKILKGEYEAPHVSIWHFKLDDIKEIADERMWLKANPNLGKTINFQAYRDDVKKAEANPAAKNDIVAKRFGIPMEGFTFFFTYAQTLPHRLPRRAFQSMKCSMGIDLSQGDDFCAFTFMFPMRGDKFGLKARSYISYQTWINLPPERAVKYQEFIDEGTLVVMDGTVLDVSGAVFDDLEAFIERNKYDVCSVGYDTYGAAEFIARWVLENSPFGVEKVIQGARTESVPLGEMRKLAQERLILFDEAIMTYCMGNATSKEDINGNRMLTKLRYEDKIDNVSAWLDAYVAYKLNKEAFE